MKRTELATAAIRIARSIEAHLTGAVATISQRNQDIVCESDQFVPVVGQGVGHLIFDFVFFLIFKAKAFRFCLFFCPAERVPSAHPLRVIPSTGPGQALSGAKDPVKIHHGFFGLTGLRMTMLSDFRN